MPRGSKGEKRPADVIGNAVHVMRIASPVSVVFTGNDCRTIGSWLKDFKSSLLTQCCAMNE